MISALGPIAHKTASGRRESIYSMKHLHISLSNSAGGHVKICCHHYIRPLCLRRLILENLIRRFTLLSNYTYASMQYFAMRFMIGHAPAKICIEMPEYM